MTIAFLFFCNHLIYAFVDRTDKDEDVGFNYVGEDKAFEGTKTLQFNGITFGNVEEAAE